MELRAVIIRALMEDNVFPTLENQFVPAIQDSGGNIANREIMDNLESQDVSENQCTSHPEHHEALVNLEHRLHHHHGAHQHVHGHSQWLLTETVYLWPTMSNELSLQK